MPLTSEMGVKQGKEETESVSHLLRFGMEGSKHKDVQTGEDHEFQCKRQKNLRKSKEDVRQTKPAAHMVTGGGVGTTLILVTAF